MDNDVLYAIGSSLVAAVATTLDTADIEAPCRMGMVPGDIVDDWCCDTGSCGGQLAGKVTRAFLAGDPWPTDRITMVGNCQTGTPTIDLMVRLTLCVPTGSGNSQQDISPTAEALDAADRNAETARWAMLCGAQMWCGAFPARAFVRGVANSGPHGGCLGLDLTVTVEVETPPDPPPVEGP